MVQHSCRKEEGIKNIPPMELLEVVVDIVDIGIYRDFIDSSVVESILECQN